MGKGRVMASDDAKQHDESGRSAPQEQGHGEQQQPAQDDSGFGPPVSGFGPPPTEFGPPVDTFGGSAFGPPTAESGPGWSPADAPARPTLGWQPADAPTYRAPDAMQPPKPPMPDPAPPTARYTDTPPSDDATERVDRETWWRASPQSYPPTPPRESTGSLWDDDELAKKLMPPRPVAPPDEPEKPRRNKGMLIGGAVAAVVVVIAGLVTTVVLVSGGKKNPAPPAGPTTPALIAVNCPAHTDGNVTTGNGPGDTSSGVGAILGFEHGYYVERSGVKARDFASPGVNLEPAEGLQKIIDQLPKGTNYCLQIESVAPDRFNVQLTEFHPDGSTVQYKQIVTTIARDGRTLVDQILRM
ncbi:hypothetical protein [Nocardia terpenica]|uniref:DUF8176 domain-containing protein n=1 Tax=Nocardia terpenica TaxID=455432 RepID=A0A6G9YXP4_9NOCA|nr:hypothetical protein [Nocardia terpenica]QIS17940.1 hypothetical protein F6W96_06075 [Nocardia terpenica]